METKRDKRTNFIRFTSITQAAAGLLFVLYPNLRPFSDESSLSGAAAFASTEWLVSHVMAILAFMLLTVGMLGLYVSLRDTRAGDLALYSLVLHLMGIGLTLPFYGAEVFGLNVIGKEAMAQQDIGLMSLADAIRFGPGFYMILAGLVIVAIGSVMTTVAIWRSRIMSRWCGIPFAIGFLTYLPQYMGTQPIRVVHGAIIAIGCIWIATAIWQQSQRKHKEPRLY